MKFKSQICTTKEQSERLLKLGLKKETADMEIEIFKMDNTIYGYVQKGYWDNEISDALIELIPAWSLHRLLVMLYADIGECIMFFPNAYDEVIANIEDRIRRGTFNKDYLEEKK